MRRLALVLFALPGCDGFADGQAREDAGPSAADGPSVSLAPHHRAGAPQLVVASVAESATRSLTAPHGDDLLVLAGPTMPLHTSSTSI
ncbi:hypothetical protein [Nannocystis pusilla]|uniref:hypothetical protein n=1 Tax=Nannocystis pusilla TaxID=889268 RepID=UPI003DA52B49